jgi:hypothetical protein
MASKKIAVSKSSCPACKIGIAVNKRTAYYAAKLKPKRRRANRAEAKRGGPQVGRRMTFEGAATDPAFLDLVAPPEPPNDRWVEYIFRIVFVACVAASVGLAIYGADERLLDLGLLLVAALLMLAAVKLDLLRFARYKKRLRGYDKTWLCLRCGHQWTKTED